MISQRAMPGTTFILWTGIRLASVWGLVSTLYVLQQKNVLSPVTDWETVVPLAVGGNGGNAAANAIQEECEKQGVHTVVAACPKSIDSDILVVSYA